MRLFYFLFILIIASCNSEDELEITPENKNDSIATIPDTKFIDKNLIDSIAEFKTNFTDKNGLKQGIWITNSGRGKLKKTETFKDGKLNGLALEQGYGEYSEYYYKNNKLDSLYFSYKDLNSTLSNFIMNFENGEKKWTGFPLVTLRTGYYIKPFQLYIDTAYIWIPYKNGKVFYTGTFVKDKQNGEGIGIGKHTMYYRNGKIKASYDYDLDSMKVFTKEGKLYKESRIQGYFFEKVKELEE